MQNKNNKNNKAGKDCTEVSTRRRKTEGLSRKFIIQRIPEHGIIWRKFKLLL